MLTPVGERKHMCCRNHICSDIPGFWEVKDHLGYLLGPKRQSEAKVGNMLGPKKQLGVKEDPEIREEVAEEELNTQ